MGIQPDIVVDPEPLLAAAAEATPPDPGGVRERDLRGHLANPEKGSREESESESEDLQLARAVEVLKSWTYFDRLRESAPSQAAVNPATETATP